jgi:hypothetical protein
MMMSALNAPTASTFLSANKNQRSFKMYLTTITESTDKADVTHAIDEKAQLYFESYLDTIKAPENDIEYHNERRLMGNASHRVVLIDVLLERNKLIEAIRVIEKHADCPDVINEVCRGCLVFAEDK